MSGSSGWAKVLKINGRFLRATFCGVIAWGCWLGFEAGSVLLGMFAVMFACGTIWHGGIALFQSIQIVVGSFKWRAFKRKGAKPKADPVAGEADLRATGLIK